jgi:DNA-binding response OmpR family regulator
VRDARSRTERPDMRVLVIREDEVIHTTVAGLTRISGVRVYAAHDQWEGRDLLGDIRPDLILCDLEPRCDGLSFVRWLRQMPAHRRTLTAAVTDSAQLSDEASRVAGFDEYLVKPITGEMLGQLLERVLRRRPSASRRSTITPSKVVSVTIHASVSSMCSWKRCSSSCLCGGSRSHDAGSPMLRPTSGTSRIDRDDR